MEPKITRKYILDKNLTYKDVIKTIKKEKKEKRIMPLQVDLRPRDLSEVFGNEAIKVSLESIFARDDRPHAFLFTGPSGCGKTTFGRIIADMLECTSEFDFHEYNTANTRGIDTIREIDQNMHYAALEGSIKVYLLDECHMITGPAANALLKMLEDPPSHVYFILCTTEPEKLLKTVLTRCTTYSVKPLTDSEMDKFLDWALQEVKTSASDKVIKEIIRIADGCPRDALKILDQVVDIQNEDDKLKAIGNITIGEVEIVEICRGIIKGESWDSMREKVRSVLQTTEPEKLRYAILGYFSAILLNSKTHDRASNVIDLFSENTFYTGKAGIVNTIYLACK